MAFVVWKMFASTNGVGSFYRKYIVDWTQDIRGVQVETPKWIRTVASRAHTSERHLWNEGRVIAVSMNGYVALLFIAD